MPVVIAHRTYLQMTSPPEEAPLPSEELAAGARIDEERQCDVATYRWLYAEVGRPYFWLDRLAWSDARLATHLARDEVRIWILRDREGMGGYFELVRGADASVEIAYFGLLASRQGRGLGRALLSRALHEGWAWGANRLWLHTCTLDSPAALPNYLARGFQPFKRESYEAVLPDG